MSDSKADEFTPDIGTLRLAWIDHRALVTGDHSQSARIGYAAEFDRALPEGGS